ncbi:hypothetical protein VFPFJ_08847 [Purpureocillium lilacinum]|nr:hypothetical protein VFPFJ_08847 [Purpureocillium lilacinum]KAK4088213.1 hypothetical protein Purlil1_7406 [Purpureocillium lilacinum]OAQ83044.1 hypothetical protein VFPFJ_08847 [Purpureocillium lilacinum]PWI75598.1 hypothetical protein PCL_06256 [Purpureocillium lilacinum]GJN70651.1 hypothetical protein PLICBS_004709 [Purpureocillium lilacinum]GJN79245.1 hypothetical protein PLIIFM63780_002758 [Purpureocillium lilacinum]
MAPSLPQLLATALLGSLCVSASPRVVHDSLTDSPTFTSKHSGYNKTMMSSSCPHKIMKKHDFTWGPTSTVWTATTTTTHHVDCGPCTALHVSRVHLGVGPQIIYTTTVTATVPTTTTMYACAVEKIARDTAAPTPDK